jgi:hypothetical protein
MCEYNPYEKRGSYEHEPCFNKATHVVGHDGKWHLCESCAALPEFNKYRVKRRVWNKYGEKINEPG